MNQIDTTKAVVKEINTERLRQIYDEGHTPEKDDAYHIGWLSDAAAVYCLGANVRSYHPDFFDTFWPFDDPPKFSTRRQSLVKAAALIVAEIEMIDRKQSIGAGFFSDKSRLSVRSGLSNDIAYSYIGNKSPDNSWTFKEWRVESGDCWLGNAYARSEACRVCERILVANLNVNYVVRPEKGHPEFKSETDSNSQ